MFRLTNVEEAGPKTVELQADANRKKLAAHVGHKIAVTGTDVDPTTMKKGTAGKSSPTRQQRRVRWSITCASIR